MNKKFFILTVIATLTFVTSCNYGGVETDTPPPWSESVVTLSTNPDNDLLFYAKRQEGSTTYYHGIKTSEGMHLTHAILEDGTGDYDIVIFNDDFLPVQWISAELTVAIYVLEGKSFDPHQAFHVVYQGEQANTLTADIYPSNLLAIVNEMELETNTKFDNARSFLQEYDISSFDDLLSLARQDGEDQPRFIAAAVAFSTSAAALSVKKANREAIAPARLSALTNNLFPYYYLIRIASGMFFHVFVRTQNYGLDPSNPANRELLLCRGKANFTGGYVCQFVFFHRDRIMDCVSQCKTSLSCFTDICMPMNMTATVADLLVDYFFR